MKGIFVIMDGLGDLPTKSLGNKTPLEKAKTPNLDFLATSGKLGSMYSVKPGFVPESDEAIVSLFGNKLISSSRGELEAKGAGLKVMRGDLCWRVNFATTDPIKKEKILDRRAGRTLTTKEAGSLAKAINKIKLPCKFLFKSTIQHRGALVFRGGFSENVLGNDGNYFKGKKVDISKVIPVKALDNLENTQYTVNIVNEFLEKARKVLENHPVNIKRKEKGLLPANFLLIRGAGVEIPNLKQYPRWFSVSYMPLEKGFSEISGMKAFSFKYPKLKTWDVYDNLWSSLKKASTYFEKILKKNLKNKKFDYAYLHFKETDIPGHDNKPVVKKEMLEYLDKTFFRFAKKFVTFNNIKMIVTGDHSTPCKLKSHSADPVPVLFYDNSVPKKKKFSEKDSKKGKLGTFLGSELFRKTGFK